jgi:5-methylcytosine-specific restriction endonuclease McrA
VNKYSLAHLADATLLSNLSALVARDRANTATMLAHLAEVEARRLYAPAGFSSLHAYCVEQLGLSEDAAYKRIHAARAAREFPALFAAVADGRLHLAAVCLLSPKLTPENVDELVAAAAHRRKSEIERMLAERYPRTELLGLVQPVAPAPLPPYTQFAPGQIAAPAREPAPQDPALRARLVPHAPKRFLLQLTVGEETHDKLRRAQALLGHAIPSGEIVEVIDRALELLVRHLEKRKFAATTAPRQSRTRATANARYIPAHVRRVARQRDGGQCAFVSDTGLRCSARARLEFDHIEPVAHGGTATVANIRLLCRTHNQLEAERRFGAGFMSEKRGRARRESAETRNRDAAREFRAEHAADEVTRDVLAGLRELGVRGVEARRAAEYAESAAAGTLEARMRAALKYVCPKPARIGGTATAS